jgi:L-asparaginase II
MPGKAAGCQDALGITLKISDGDPNLRAGSLVVMAVLKALSVLDDRQAEALSAYDRRPVRNWRSKQVGEIRLTDEFARMLETLK